MAVTASLLSILLVAPLALARPVRGRVAQDRDPLAVEPSYRDVRLAWAIRAAVAFGNTIVVAFVAFYVRDVLHRSVATRLTSLVLLFAALSVLGGAAWSGRASDRTRRRRPYVKAALATMGAGEFLLAMWQSPLGACVSACVVGLGYGIYLAVDQALTADVLPRPTAYGRDMGWMNVANVLPQIAAPLVASAVLDVTASYRVLYIAASALAILTIFMVSHIRSVS